jgi:hypothetical protein
VEEDLVLHEPGGANGALASFARAQAAHLQIAVRENHRERSVRITESGP